MGAQSFRLTVEATDAGSAFDMLVEEYQYEKGHDRYNGTISTCSMGRCKKSFRNYTKDNEIVARDFISKDDNGEKWVAHYIDLGVVRRERIRIVKAKKKYTAEMGWRFVICDAMSGNPISAKHSYADKKEAELRMEEFLLSHPDRELRIDKVKQRVKGNATVVEARAVTEPIKRISKSTPKGVKVTEVHKYIFYGWASI